MILLMLTWFMMDTRRLVFFRFQERKTLVLSFFPCLKVITCQGGGLGFAVGNKDLIYALSRIKSYQDYGMFQPIQIAATVALNGSQDCVADIREMYCSRRNTLCDGLNRSGWIVERPKATMFVWAQIPQQYKSMGSLEFSKLLLEKSKIAVSPGIGFGEGGDHFVRFSLVENEHRIKQAVRGIREIF